jgi:RNA polymerase sigma-70 factor (ECF subfamily)
MHAPGHDLVSRAAGGEEAARAELLAQHLGALRAYVRMRLGRALRAKEESAELAQSVVREALEDLPRLEDRGHDGFRRWLLVRAEHKIQDRGRFWRRERRDARREVAPATAADRALHSLTTPSRVAAGREELARLERAFAELPADQREVILKSRVAGLTHEQIAREMGRTPQATRSLLSREMARLAMRLESG